MTKEEIHKLEIKNPVFKIKRADLEVDGESYYIQANIGGLYQYAQKLIDAADQIEQETELTKVDLSKESWVNGEVQIDYIEVIRHDQTLDALENKNDSNVKEDLIKYGCISIFLILVIATIVGVVTITKWLM